MTQQKDMYATTVTNDSEIEQIVQLSRSNSINLLASDERKDGFITWSYDADTLKQLQAIAPCIIVKDGDIVAGYAIVLLQEAAGVYTPLKGMLEQLSTINYLGKPLTAHSFYVMGQVCVHPSYRGKGVFELLYQQHKTSYASQYSLLVTEISTANLRSQRAHEKVGFQHIHTHTDELGEWHVVVWDWR